ncbi:hypothetical protein CVIRNUC_006743 [Coccomyxa viridis]|uniref:Phosphoacetylglucosamine mutase n=1 Tax=Coccomyxa viridis TaxID=1274662 RepID=A0AAV1IC55_9CHLO|nr:hypothetical protein CVIRNUC_006743 [Coccomyxa viridis]
MDLAQLMEACNQYAKPAGFRPAYGTAGFRAEASLLHSTVFRCGLLMAARALKTGAATGLVVTASHNPVTDNGVKLVEPTGYMLDQSWEAWADKLADAEDAEALCAIIRDLYQKEDIPYGSGVVMLAHDTRPSAEELIKAAGSGVKALGGLPIVCGLLTTPQLHWMVRHCNNSLKHTESCYYEEIATGFSHLVHSCKAKRQVLTVDCANGVGAEKLKALAERLSGKLDVTLRSTGEGGLNDGCGADYVQKERRFPAGMEDCQNGARCASLDGDADRLVYFQRLPGGQLQLLDGDRIAVLAALLIRDILDRLSHDAASPSVGIVQTAYANGASSQYIREQLRLETAVTATGVKHLHAAAERFDIGIYFEANGHGTVLFRPALIERLHKLGDSQEAAKDLLALLGMVNQAVGDALSGILLVEAALRRRQWGLNDWAQLYTDLPSRQLKVKVKDRSVVTTADAETRAVTPEGLQSRINESVRGAPSGRAFVRPSGTEDVVRVYAEAQTQQAADKLAQQVARHVHELAAGIGAAP